MRKKKDTEKSIIKIKELNFEEKILAREFEGYFRDLKEADEEDKSYCLRQISRIMAISNKYIEKLIWNYQFLANISRLILKARESDNFLIWVEFCDIVDKNKKIRKAK
jgi:hypothetical protein